MSEPSRFIDTYLAYLLRRASETVSTDFYTHLDTTNLSVTEWRVLACLHDNHEESVTDLAYHAVMKQPTLSKALLRMEQDGLIERRQEPGDRRQIMVRNTRKGTTIAADLCRVAKEHQDDIMQNLTERERKQLISILRKLISTSEGD